MGRIAASVTGLVAFGLLFWSAGIWVSAQERTDTEQTQRLNEQQILVLETQKAVKVLADKATEKERHAANIKVCLEAGGSPEVCETLK
jgi:hypothetical protein